jgi:elongation factor P
MLPDMCPSSLLKAAVLETGIKVQVPQFIGAGDVVRVDTRDGHYIERVRSA